MKEKSYSRSKDRINVYRCNCKLDKRCCKCEKKARFCGDRKSVRCQGCENLGDGISIYPGDVWVLSAEVKGVSVSAENDRGMRVHRGGLLHMTNPTPSFVSWHVWPTATPGYYYFHFFPAVCPTLCLPLWRLSARPREQSLGAQFSRLSAYSNLRLAEMHTCPRYTHPPRALCAHFILKILAFIYSKYPHLYTSHLFRDISF